MDIEFTKNQEPNGIRLQEVAAGVPFMLPNTPGRVYVRASLDRRDYIMRTANPNVSLIPVMNLQTGFVSSWALDVMVLLVRGKFVVEEVES